MAENQMNPLNSAFSDCAFLGSSPLRSDARHSPELEFQPPPRKTRSEPVAGPVGFVGGVHPTTANVCSGVVSVAQNE